MWPGSVSSGFASSSLHLSAEVVKALMGEELTEEELLKVGTNPAATPSSPSALCDKRLYVIRQKQEQHSVTSILSNSDQGCSDGSDV